MKLTKFKARYHRNGVGGRGFYACTFTAERRQHTAVLFFDGDGPGYPGWDRLTGECAVLTSDIGECWRGDDFETAVRAEIAKINAADPMALHRP